MLDEGPALEDGYLRSRRADVDDHEVTPERPVAPFLASPARRAFAALGPASGLGRPGPSGSWPARVVWAAGAWAAAVWAAAVWRRWVRPPQSGRRSGPPRCGAHDGRPRGWRSRERWPGPLRRRSRRRRPRRLARSSCRYLARPPRQAHPCAGGGAGPGGQWCQPAAVATSSGRSPARARPANVTSVPATRSLRTLRLVTGGDPGRVSPIFGLGGGGAGSDLRRRRRRLHRLVPVILLVASRPRKCRCAGPGRRENLAGGDEKPLLPHYLALPHRLDLYRPRPHCHRGDPNLRLHVSAHVRWGTNCVAGRPSQASLPRPGLTRPARSWRCLLRQALVPTLKTFPSKQARSGARHAHVATGTSGDVPGRAAGSQPRAVAPYR